MIQLAMPQVWKTAAVRRMYSSMGLGNVTSHARELQRFWSQFRPRLTLSSNSTFHAPHRILELSILLLFFVILHFLAATSIFRTLV